jgi:hypothetical protein
VLLSKGSEKEKSCGSQKLLNEAIIYTLECEFPERKIYSRYISSCLEHGVDIELDAKTAYSYIKNKLERL